MKPLAQFALVLLAAFAVTAGLILGTPRGTPASPAPVPSMFCPAGQHVTGVHAGMPECSAPPSPRRTGLRVTP